MPRNRLSLGESLAASAGVVLFLATFFPWFEQESSGGIGGTGGHHLDRTLNAWSAFALLAVLLLLVAGMPIWQAARRIRDDVPGNPQLLLAAGALGVALVLGGAAMKFGDTGGSGADSVHVSTTAAAGFVVALLAALAIAAAGVITMWRPRSAGPRRARR